MRLNSGYFASRSARRARGEAQMGETQQQQNQVVLSDQLEKLIDELPDDQLTIDELIERCGEEGLLLLSALLTLVFLIPVSIPGVSTVFGAVILLVGAS